VLTSEDARDIAPKILGLVRANGNLRVLEDAVATRCDAQSMAQCPAQEAHG
jgi:hypothetical protein